MSENQNSQSFPEESTEQNTEEPQTSDNNDSGVVKKSFGFGFSGPLPPPSILSQYDEIVPNGAERIMQMAEQQLQHRIEMEKRLVEEDTRQGARGQNYALIVSLVAFASAVILGVTGNETAATIIAGIDIIALATVFIVGKTMALKAKDLEDPDIN
ncbi:DUF2335 domain-containing protein [Prosthecochloris vibrioformis]|uniref:DUF2335 domain-containing protein n=1 Tax=Prosthecochloris vibrioformis TaxID=1098 RepID=A0A5C4S083_PROVB|nr:DUF2335 domain-containing protein [Prosthecochloris vibrioformis]TNJ36830.1 DUF2335 domain-containing protein [Prosthecochloris vibrioformis]